MANRDASFMSGPIFCSETGETWQVSLTNNNRYFCQVIMVLLHTQPF